MDSGKIQITLLIINGIWFFKAQKAVFRAYFEFADVFFIILIK